MAIESVTCPSCGATGIQTDTAREHSFCSYCGSTVRTKDVLHLDVESMTLEKLKRNAQCSFELGQYSNAEEDWRQAIQLDRTDHESYWGLVCCAMATQPDKMIESGHYEQALIYAPPDVRAQYVQQIEAHNARARAIIATHDADVRIAQEARSVETQTARDAKIHEAEAEIARLQPSCKTLGVLLVLCIVMLVIWFFLPNLMYAIGGVPSFAFFSQASPVGIIILLILSVALFAARHSKKQKLKENQKRLDDIK